MLKLLDEYDDKLTRTAQIIYGLKIEVEWGKIMRFSTTSNFALITGKATVSKGEKIENVTLEEDYIVTASMTLLLDMLDDDSTPYQLAEAAQAIATVRQVLGPEEFHNFLVDETSDMEKILAILPKHDTADDDDAEHTQAPDDNIGEPQTISTSEMNTPGKLSGFDLQNLNDAQQESFKLSYMANYMKVHN